MRSFFPEIQLYFFSPRPLTTLYDCAADFYLTTLQSDKFFSPNQQQDVRLANPAFHTSSYRYMMVVCMLVNERIMVEGNVSHAPLVDCHVVDASPKETHAMQNACEMM